MESSPDGPGADGGNQKPSVLLISVFLVATCGLVYELIAGTLASYLLGDSIFQFSTVIGCYLFAMGVGSYLAQYLGQRNPVVVFVRLQIMIGLLGGCSASLMFLAFSYSGGFRVVLYALVFLVGMLVGVEIPLVMTILKRHFGFRELVSQVLALDYLGALLASLLFPIFLVPHLGLVRTSFLCGLINVSVSLAFFAFFPELWKRFRGVAVEAGLVLLLLLVGLVYSDWLTTWAEEALYPDPILMARSTAYQRMVVTRAPNDTRLYLNGNLQFSSRDEYRYHEALVHPALCSTAMPKSVAIFGGGDGLAARELLRDPRVEKITLVDLDPEMTRIFSTHVLLSKLNLGSLTNKRLHVINGDAFVWLKSHPDQFDLAIVDFPDPSNFSVGKLYTTAFYRSLAEHLTPQGVVAVQCTSPLFARRSFWCIINTIRAAGWKVRPYHLYVPSFGEWGYALASKEKEAQPDPARLVEGLRYLNAETLADIFVFPQDMAPVEAAVNRLFDQVLVRYYDQEWRTVTE